MDEVKSKLEDLLELLFGEDADEEDIIILNDPQDKQFLYYPCCSQNYANYNNY